MIMVILGFDESEQAVVEMPDRDEVMAIFRVVYGCTDEIGYELNLS